MRKWQFSNNEKMALKKLKLQSDLWATRAK